MNISAAANYKNQQDEALHKDKVVEQKVCGNCKVGDRPDLQKELYLIDAYELPFYLCNDCLVAQINSEKSEVNKIEDSISDVQGKLEKVEDKISAINQKIQESMAESNSDYSEKSIQQILEQKKKGSVLTQNLETLKNRVLDFEISESAYWAEVNVFEKRLQTLLSKKLIADNLERIYDQKLQKLNKFNTLNSLFQITVVEQTGLINSLAIGKHLNEDINWDETNAGLGQVALLFVYLTNKFGYTMSLIKDIEICGNESCICEANKNESLYLKGPFQNKTEETKFNRAMKLFIDEFDLFQMFLAQKALPPIIMNFQLPFKIDSSESTIDSLKYTTTVQNSPAQFKGLDNWTQAFKKLLINFKYIISLNALYDSKREIEILSKE